MIAEVDIYQQTLSNLALEGFVQTFLLAVHTIKNKESVQA